MPNLPVNYRGIVTRVIDPNVIGITEPWLEGSNDPRAFLTVCQFLQGPIMRTMVALSAFAAIFAATGGGPGTATEILNLYAYRTSFAEFNLGYGAALAVVLLAITLSVSALMFRLRSARCCQPSLAARGYCRQWR